QRPLARRRPSQAEVRGRVPHRAARRRGASGLRATLPLRSRGPSRGERPRHEEGPRVRHCPGGEAHRRRLELLRLRRAPRQPLLRRRGLPAQRQPHLPRGARPGRGRPAGERVSLAAPGGGDDDPPTRTHSRLLHAQRDRPLPEAALRPDHHGLQPHDAVHPRGGSRPMFEAVTTLPRTATESLSSTAADLLPAPISRLQHEIGERMLRIPTRLNAYGYDPWGFHVDTTRCSTLVTALLYRYWF